MQGVIAGIQENLNLVMEYAEKTQGNTKQLSKDMETTKRDVDNCYELVKVVQDQVSQQETKYVTKKALVE